ncbi:luciferase family protein [Nonomuraea sp. NPDC051941]|uniref:luciferase domain-containing protein n=1 Tax=Nonomuraea sp. NPDC051941 TaxID=3364373 RepID=UPI0037CA0C60
MAPFREAAQERRASLLSQAVHQLRSWPALTFLPTAAGAVFTSGGREIVRLTGPSTAHLHLTTPVIDRLRSTLCACTHLETNGERGWAAIAMETSVDLDLVLGLVSVAIKANDCP